MNTLLFVALFGMCNLDINYLSYNSQFLQQKQNIVSICNNTNSVIIDTIVYWRADKKINKVMSLYVSYKRNNDTDYIVEKEIRIKGEMLNGRMNGPCCFYHSQSHDLIAKASYKKGKICGDVLIFDNGKVVEHYMYKNDRCLGLCDKDGKLLKIRRHYYYHPKKECFCDNYDPSGKEAERQQDIYNDNRNLKRSGYSFLNDCKKMLFSLIDTIPLPSYCTKIEYDSEGIIDYSSFSYSFKGVEYDFQSVYSSYMRDKPKVISLMIYRCDDRQCVAEYFAKRCCLRKQNYHIKRAVPYAHRLFRIYKRKKLYVE